MTAEDSIASDKVDFDQVIKNDVVRSFVHYTGFKDLKDPEAQERKLELQTMLVALSDDAKKLSYYQGLNFITEAFYNAHGLVNGYLLVQGLVQYIFAPYMYGNKEFDQAIKQKMALSYQILKHEVRDLEQILDFQAVDEKKDVAFERLNFTASWYLTLLAYKVQDLQVVFRIFDFLVCSLNSHADSYFMAALVMYIIATNEITKKSDKMNTMPLFYNGKFELTDIETMFEETFLLLNKHCVQDLEQRIEKEKKTGVLKFGINKFLGFFR